MTISIQPALAENLTREFANTHIRADVTELLENLAADYYEDEIYEAISNVVERRHPVIASFDNKTAREAVALTKPARDREVFSIILRDYRPNEEVCSHDIFMELYSDIQDSLYFFYIVTPQLQSQLAALGEVTFEAYDLPIWYAATSYKENSNYLNLMHNNYVLGTTGQPVAPRVPFDEYELDSIFDTELEPEIPFIPFGRATRFETPVIPVFKIN